MTGKTQVVAASIPARMLRLSPPAIHPLPSALSVSNLMAISSKPKGRLNLQHHHHQQTSIFSTASHDMLVPHPSALSKSTTIFNTVWKKLEDEFHSMRMPGDILWLIGAPGSGKGTVTPHIIQAQNTNNLPICMSTLLQTPELQAVINSGKMVDDFMVLEQLLRALLSRDPTQPLVVDGFPRTPIQVDFVTLLHKKLQINSVSLFKVAILYVSQETSLARQLNRGMEARLNNAKVRLMGKGDLMEERMTDLDESLVMTRYRTFKQHMNSVMGLAHHFPFHMINADCGVEDVVKHILHLFDARYPQQHQPKNTPAPVPENPIWHGFNSSSPSHHQLNHSP